MLESSCTTATVTVSQLYCQETPLLHHHFTAQLQQQEQLQQRQVQQKQGEEVEMAQQGTSTMRGIPPNAQTSGRAKATENAANAASNGGGRSTSLSVVGERYRVGKKIGEGSFGIIYEGVNIETNEQVAIKFEPRKSDAPQLRDEYKTYQILSGTTGVPQVYFYGIESSYNVLVLDLLGPSLEDLFELCSRTFSIKTVCMLAKQMLQRVRACHEKHLIYRDIKPDNFLMGRGPNSGTVFLIDFGMAKYYRDPHSKIHIPYREKKSLSGTARYMSINTHLGREQSRRDDLEALGHVFMYFLRGGLPWQGLKAATNKQKYEKIGEKKQQVSISELCHGYPDEFAKYLTYARHLKFEEQPDYDYLIKLFNTVLKKQHLVDDGMFDWMQLDGSKPVVVETESSRRLQGREDTRPNASAGKLKTSSTPVQAMPTPEPEEEVTAGCCACFGSRK